MTKASSHFGVTTRVGRLREAPGALVQMLQALPAADSADSRVVRLEVGIPATDLISWLHGQSSPRVFYWRDRDGETEIAGIETTSVDTGTAPVVRADTHGQACEAVSFCVQPFPYRARDNDFCWADLGQVGSVLPLIEMRRSKNDYVLACHFSQARNQRQVERLVHRLNSLRDAVSQVSAVAVPTVSEDTPDRPAWCSLVGSALGAIRQNEVQKVVLARQRRLTWDTGIDPFSLLQALGKSSGDSFLFLLKNDKHVFLGASPELLYRRQGDHLTVEALAGTRPRGSSEERDKQLAAELMSSIKERHEHDLVQAHFEQALAGLAVPGTTVPCGAPAVARLPNVQHLCRRYEARLRSGVDDHEIIRVLHPSPAVAGTPRDIAGGLITRLEPFDRGLYAGVVGLRSRSGSVFAVAIRSALLFGNTLTCFAGAGIVEGSDPDQEWQETEAKLTLFTRLWQEG